MKWIKYLLIFCAIYYSLIFVLSLPNSRTTLNTWVAPKIERFLKWSFPQAYFKIEWKQQNNQPDAIWVQYESRKKIEALFSQAGPESSASIKFFPKQYFILIHPLLVFPFSLLMALIIATPQSIKGKAMSIAIGSLLLWLYFIGNVYIKQLFMFQSLSVELYEWSEPFKGFIIRNVPKITPGVSISFVLIIWILTSIRKSHFNLFTTPNP